MSEPLTPLRSDERDEIGRLLARGSRSLRTPPMPRELRDRILRSVPASTPVPHRLGWLKGGGLAVGCATLFVAAVRVLTAAESAAPPAPVLAPESKAEPFASAQHVVSEAADVPTTSVTELPDAPPAAPTFVVQRSPHPPPPSGDSLAREVELLEKARASATANETLALLEEHARRFPNGKLALEREVFVVQTLLRDGRTKEAELRGRAIVAKDPESPHAARVKELLR